MTPRDINSIELAQAIVERRGLKYVKVGVFDTDGILRGKYMSRKKFLSALKTGFGFCDVIAGWDANDQLYDNTTITGWHTGYPDAKVRILPESCREIPWEDNMLFFLGELDGPHEVVCPRAILRRALNLATDMGLRVMAGFEYEFFIFQETPKSLRDKNFKDLIPMQPGYFGYSLIRNTVESDFYHDLLETCSTMDFPLEGLHEETGPGVLEAAIEVDSAANAADKAALFKTFTKIMAQKKGMMATFMAKCSPDWPGQSGHIHISLRSDTGHPVFYEPTEPNEISTVMRHFIGGQQQLMPEFLAMIAPTVNSYKRLIPGFWAPSNATWGIDNRTCALRVITGTKNSQRIEYRLAAADANPYLALAAAVGSGLWGIKNQLEPRPAIKGNAYTKKLPKNLDLPSTLWDSAQRLKASKPASKIFGEKFIDHFVASREWEVREFQKHITDWEMERYFEII